MSFLTIVYSDIPAADEGKFLEAFPKYQKDLESQAGVTGVTIGRIVLEDGVKQSGFNILQSISFESAENAKAFEESAFVKDIEAKYGKPGEEKNVLRFALGEFHGDYKQKPFIQFSTISLGAGKKGEDAESAWYEFATTVGRQATGGHSTDGPQLGLGLVSWDSLEDVTAAFSDPKVLAAFEKYEKLGKVSSVVIELLK